MSGRQARISDGGGLGFDPCGPLSWDGEPLFSSSTVREGLFDAQPFEQLPGQLAAEWEPECGRDYCRGRECCGCVSDERAMFRGFGWSVSG